MTEERSLIGLHEACVGALPNVAAAEREAIDGGTTDVAAHGPCLASLPFARALEARPAPSGAPRSLDATARIVAWNLQRCCHPAASAALVDRAGADVLLLSELDCGMARSGQQHTARALADTLGCGYAFAVEFLELGLGDAAEQQRHAGESNRDGYHGGAILGRATQERPALVRLEASGAWFDGSRGERRVGGRIAVLSTFRVAGADVVFAAVHLDSHGETEERAQQLATLLDAIETYRPGAPALIGGDLNTFSFGRRDSSDPARLKALLEQDPGRLSNPVRYEPLFALAESRGYAWRACNVEDEPTQRVVRASSSERGGLKIDWFLARGLQTSEPEVIPCVDPELGALSDHDPIAVTVAPA